MFKIIALCTLLVTIYALPTHHDVNSAVIAPENEPAPAQEVLVPVEQALRTSESQNEKVVDATPLESTVAEGNAENSANIKAATSEITPNDAVKSDALLEDGQQGSDKTKTIGLILLLKLGTTTTPMPAE